MSEGQPMRVAHLPHVNQKILKQGEVPFHPLKLVIQQGDIIKQRVDAIINPANDKLTGDGGLDFMIHKAAGKKLTEECLALNGCETGEAKITGGHDLAAKHVIHAVGPIYPDTTHPMTGLPYPDYEQRVAKAEMLLAKTYESILRVAKENKLGVIAIPAVSTGIFSFPKEQAVRIVHDTIYKYFQENQQGTLSEIRFVLWDKADFKMYEKEFSDLLHPTKT